MCGKVHKKFLRKIKILLKMTFPMKTQTDNWGQSMTQFSVFFKIILK